MGCWAVYIGEGDSHERITTSWVHRFHCCVLTLIACFNSDHKIRTIHLVSMFLVGHNKNLIDWMISVASFL